MGGASVPHSRGLPRSRQRAGYNAGRSTIYASREEACMPRPSWYDDDDDESEDGVDADKSKSQVKRELLALDPLTEELMDLPDKQQNSLGLSDELLAALRIARSLKRGARKRKPSYSLLWTAWPPE